MGSAIPDRPLIHIIREGLEKACKEFDVRVKPLGFSRTKKMLWTRPHDLTVDFISFSRSGSSYGAPSSASVKIRVHLGIRILNDGDNCGALTINGPSSDNNSSSKIRSGRYHLRFNAISGSTFARCIDDLERFAVEQGEPWFKRFSSIWNLLYRWDSPLKSEQKKLLRKARSGQATQESVATSLKILGIKSKEARK